jgi:hypothetical protein
MLRISSSTHTICLWDLVDLSILSSVAFGSANGRMSARAHPNANLARYLCDLYQVIVDPSGLCVESTLSTKRQSDNDRLILV